MSPVELDAIRRCEESCVHPEGHVSITDVVGMALLEEGDYEKADALLSIARRAVPRYSISNLELTWNALLCRRQLREDPLPEDMAAFSPSFTILYSPETATGNVAIYLQLEAGLCPPEHLATLALFAYDRENGWQRIEGQKLNPISQSFSALDFGVRTYAVLGPAEHLLRPPANGASTP